MRRMIGGILMAAVTAAAALAAAIAPAGADEPEWNRIHFPVQEPVHFTDDWGAPRAGGRTHQGNDLMGAKLDHLLAAADGVVRTVRLDSGISGNILILKADDGWSYYYIHVNNDTPGTDDGLNPAEFAFAPGIAVGTKVKAGQFIAYMGDSGDAETTGPHLHFEVHKPDGTAIDPWTSLRLAQGLPAGTRCSYGSNPTAAPSARSGTGYWALGRDGGVFSFGAAQFYGSTGALKLNKPIVGMAAAPTGKGYWLVASDGGIFAYGDAQFFGSTGALRLNKPIVGMSSTPTGKGYWLVASDGGIFAYGDAQFFGSTGAMALNKPVNGMASTPTGKGYWLIASDGGMFAFGDAQFSGSVPGLKIATTVVSMAATKTGAGYWLLAADGGVFSFGDAVFRGSLPGSGLCKWPAGIQLVPTATGKGYWVQATDGSTWTFGDAASFGSVAGLRLPAPVTTIGLAPIR